MLDNLERRRLIVADLPEPAARPTISSPKPDRSKLAILILGVTLAQLALIAYIRQDWGYGPMDWSALRPALGDIWVFESVVSGLLLPLVLAYLLGRSVMLRHFIEGEPSARDSLLLLVALSAMQVLTLASAVGRGVDFLGFFVPIVAGLVGGLPMGLALGLFSYGLYALVFSLQTHFDAWSLAALSQIEPGELLGSMEILRGVMEKPDLSPLLWAGIVAGAGALLIGPGRFRPLSGFGLGFVIQVTGFYMLAGFDDEPAWIAQEYLLPSALAVGLATAGFNLIISDMRSRLEQQRSEAAELARTQAELRALRAQINPHFLFNSLNTIRYFVRTDSESARRLLLALSEVFQRALRAGDFVSLQMEIEHVQAYLELELARLGERLKVEWDLPKALPASLEVPTLILQPLVENAVLHGIAPMPEGGLLRIRARIEARGLEVTVEDNGKGITADALVGLLDPARPSTSIGLRNVDGRLRAHYGPSAGLSIQSKLDEGTQISFTIPISVPGG